MPDSTIDNLPAATPATGGNIPVEQDVTRRLVMTPAGAVLAEAADALAQRDALFAGLNDAANPVNLKADAGAIVEQRFLTDADVVAGKTVWAKVGVDQTQFSHWLYGESFTPSLFEAWRVSLDSTQVLAEVRVPADSAAGQSQFLMKLPDGTSTGIGLVSNIHGGKIITSFGDLISVDFDTSEGYFDPDEMIAWRFSGSSHYFGNLTEIGDLSVLTNRVAILAKNGDQTFSSSVRYIRYIGGGQYTFTLGAPYFGAGISQGSGNDFGQQITIVNDAVAVYARVTVVCPGTTFRGLSSIRLVPGQTLHLTAISATEWDYELSSGYTKEGMPRSSYIAFSGNANHSDNRAEYLRYTGTGGHTLTLADPTSYYCEPYGPKVVVKNRGSGNLTVAAYGATTIEGAASVVLAPGEYKTFHCISNSSWDVY